MNYRNWGLGIAATALLAGALTGCAAGGSGGSSEDTGLMAPVVMSIDELQGATVDLVVGQVLDIDTGDVPVGDVGGRVYDTAVAEFSIGYELDGTTFNPGVTALEVGSVQIDLFSVGGEFDDVTFTVDVTAAP